MSEFIGNKIQIEQFKQFLNDNRLKTLLLDGPIGCGKTKLCKLICQELAFEPCFLNFESSSTHKENKKILNNAVFSCNILDFMQKKQKCIILDSSEIILSNDKFMLKYLEYLLINQKLLEFKLIIVVAKNEERRFSDLKKLFHQRISLQNPCFHEAMQFLKTIVLTEKIPINDKELTQIVINSANNICAILLTLQDLKFGSTRNNTYFDNSMVDSMLQLYKTHDISDLDVLCNIEPCLFPYLVYDNFHVYHKNSCTATDNLMIKSIVDSYIDANMLHVSMYQGEHQIATYIMLLSILLPIQKTHLKRGLSEKDFSHTQILTKTALKHIMDKKMFNLLHSHNKDTFALYDFVDDALKTPSIMKKKSDTRAVANTVYNILKNK